MDEIACSWSWVYNTPMIKITTLLENSTVRHNVLAQHGQALLIETAAQKILFDVGEIYEGLRYNLDVMNCDLDDITHIVISHRHIDHIGSLTKLLPELHNQKLLLPTQLGQPDMKKSGPKYVFMGAATDGHYNVAATEATTDELLSYPHAVVVSEPQEILPNLWTTGCVGEKMAEQALVFDQKEKGLVLMVGCSHPGLATFVERAQKITGNTKIRAILGGFHFNPLSDEQVIEQARYLAALNLECLMPNHCTGVKQTDILCKHLPDTVKISKTYSVGTGNSVTIGESIEFDVV